MLHPQPTTVPAVLDAVAALVAASPDESVGLDNLTIAAMGGDPCDRGGDEWDDEVKRWDEVYVATISLFGMQFEGGHPEIRRDVALAIVAHARALAA